MNGHYPLSHQLDDEFHRSSSLNQFGFVAPQLGPYSMNSHFRNGADRHDCMLSSFVNAVICPLQLALDAVSHTSTGIPGRNFDSSYSPPPHENTVDAELHLNWADGTHLNPHSHISSHNGSFIPYPSSYASQNLVSYDFYDHPLSPSHEFLHGNSFSYTQDSIVIHPSRSAPPSCSTSPLVHDMAVDYLDVPLMQNRLMSREHSPAKSDNDPSDAKRRFPCLVEGCARRFTSQYTLRVHMEAHKPKPKVSFPCTLGCSERFSRQHDRLRHEVSKHGKICEFSCEECGRFFSSKKTLGNHKCPVAHGTTRWMDGQ
ncbi:hypothetical protein M378DRAFT_955807 [Amanita muscaria Koide BX008]|uniref:C2H2-type domain-containing protein n=1 Tax=Amanita muscaria (strain Koide BX008) TaxID=946122 RepID=A0A0C2T0V2_AMAMK|nr:hypothetical protein M378DRAFT_955807 [Amanita muscaria Koide BX008]